MQLLSHYVHLNPLSSSLCQGFTHALGLSYYRKLKSLSHCMVEDKVIFTWLYHILILSESEEELYALSISNYNFRFYCHK